MTRLSLSTASLVATGLGMLAAPSPAAACGGFFCNAVDPVLQTGERILFLVDKGEDATTITTVVEIQFEGAASDFGWVLPIPQVIDTDAVSTAPPGLFDEIEAATAMQFVTAEESADAAPSAIGYSQSGCGGLWFPWGMEGDAIAGEPPSFDLVEVVGEAVVGPYAIEIITAEDASQLTGWLQQNGYAIPGSAMEPIAHYVSSGSAFLGLKLQPDVPEGPIDALQFTYTADEPSLPLYLTSIAAAQDMEIIAYVLADQRYVPSGYTEVDFDYGLVQWTDEGTDYEERLSTAIDFAGGRAFQTEFAGPTADLRTGEASAELLSRGTYLTRMRTFVSPEEMTMDPVWRADFEAADVSNVRVIGGSVVASRGTPAAPVQAAAPGALLGLALLLVGARRRS
jgi:hypothetical protein